MSRTFGCHARTRSGSVTDIAKALGALWRGATPADKAPFIALAEEDKDRYQREVDALPPELRPQTKAQKKKEQQQKRQEMRQEKLKEKLQEKLQRQLQKKKPAPKKAKEKQSTQRSKPKPPTGPAKPKGALTAYMFFVKAKRASLLAENPEMAKSVTEAAKATGALWRALTDQEKEPYLALAEADKARHAREMQTYLANTQGRTASVSGGRGRSASVSGGRGRSASVSGGRGRSASVSGGSGPPHRVAERGANSAVTAEDQVVPRTRRKR
eukprot:COSAG02_NODE_1951_length_10286_cov_4.096005_7_plen_270_part_00